MYERLWVLLVGSIIGIHSLNPAQHAEGSKVHHNQVLKVPLKNVIYLFM